MNSTESGATFDMNIGGPLTKSVTVDDSNSSSESKKDIEGVLQTNSPVTEVKN